MNGRREGFVGVAPTRARSVPTIGATVVAFFRRDSAERRVAGMSFVLDFGFGVVNLIVFSFISELLQEPGRAELGDSGSYFDFVAVGITFMLVVQATATQITSRLQEEQRSGTLEMLATQPIGTAALAIGTGAYPTVFAVVRSAAYLGVASLLLGLDVDSANWLAFAVMLLLGGAVTMCLGIVLAAVTVAFDHGATLGRLVIVLVAFASGTYFPVAALPQLLQWLSAPLPTRIALDGLRAALSGGGWGGPAVLLALAAALGLPLAIWLFGRALRLAVHRGTLTRG